MLRRFFYNARTRGPSLARDIIFLVKPDHLERMTVWHMAIRDIFDERRPAPAAYGRLAWSKVVSYLILFRYVFRFWSEVRRCLTNKSFQKTTSYTFIYCATAVEHFFCFLTP